ncbi:YgeY family selenium metabolism-linked hydrolase [Alicyclobacillaceae bacterium I2511]|nr:YgeY family selenium metabolism-linked hydrolase [Alicyclobacillaceae bacterium I2511]
MGTGVDKAGLVNFTLQLIAQESLSGQEGGVAKLVKAEMERLGMETFVDEWGNVTGVLDAGPGPVVLLDSHMDTVGVTDPAQWSHAPFGERLGDRIYGRGAMDMKGPLAASIYGVATLKNVLRQGKVVVSASVAEELVEGPALVHVAKQYHPDRVLICEATGLKLNVGQRGRAEICVEVYGKPTHSSRPELGINAVEHMADIIQALREVPVPEHPVLGRGVLVLTDILSRPYPGLSVVPDYCVATFDRRTLPGEKDEDVLQPVQEVVDRVLAKTGARGNVGIAKDNFSTYTGVAVTAPNFAPAWYVGAEDAGVQQALTGLRKAGIDPQVAHYAFCTNGSGTAGTLGIPTLGFGPGDESLAHRIDESVEIGELVQAAEGYAGMVREWMGGRD